MKINLYIMTEQTVSTKEIDYLEEDTPIKNQNYCLLSFISPNTEIISVLSSLELIIFSISD